MHPSLSKAEQERLIKLAEECAEVQQVIAKILLHGFEDTHPKLNETNRQLLQKELGDVEFWIEYMCRFNDLHIGTIEERAKNKIKTARKFTYHQPGSEGRSK